MKLISKFKSSFGLFLLSWKNPSLMTVNNFKSITGVYDFLYRVKEENRPYMSRLGIAFEDGGKTEVISIWACPTASGDPTKRIEELLLEIETLKRQIK